MTSGISQDRPRAGTTRTFAPIVDQHATWIAVNPIQGCPKGCAYCFLRDRGQAPARPVRMADPGQTADLLLASPFYAAERPVALYTWTDVMASADSRTHLAGLLTELAERGTPNPIVLITKCQVPDDTIRTISGAISVGVRVIVYLSYSGLRQNIERGIRHENVRANFPRLADAGIPIVHYWRPAFPESATTDVMDGVLALAAKHARCSMAAGLKVEAAALDRLAEIWPELAGTSGVSEAECVYPRPFWEFIHKTWQRYPEYPVFHANSCALAYVLGQADSHSVYGTDLCRLRNHCPEAQRDCCEVAASARAPLTPSAVREAINRRGLHDVTFKVDQTERTVMINVAAASSVVAALTRDLNATIVSRRMSHDPYWNSGTGGALPLVIG
jgi:DNA repair photolyase